MNKEIKDERDVGTIKIFGLLLPKMPSLMFRLTGTLIRLKSQANRAGRMFKKELVKQGIDKETAKELTENYMQSSRIRNYIQYMGR